ncbi:uncharacterized protein LOC144350823 [Saccoglossus kowalevskii]
MTNLVSGLKRMLNYPHLCERFSTTDDDTDTSGGGMPGGQRSMKQINMNISCLCLNFEQNQSMDESCLKNDGYNKKIPPTGRNKNLLQLVFNTNILTFVKFFMP